MASITIAEYRTGIELADTAERAAERARALATITAVIDGAHDLIVAAHAVKTARVVLSRDAKARFGELPGVVAIDALIAPKRPFR